MCKIQSVVIFIIINIMVIYNGNAQTLSSSSATGSASTNSNILSTVTSLSINVENVDNVLIVSTFELLMFSNGYNDREATFRIADVSDPFDNSGDFIRQLNCKKSAYNDIGSIVNIFDVSSYTTGSRTYNLEHSYTGATACHLATKGTLVAVTLGSGTNSLKNSVKKVTSPDPMSTSWTEVDGTTTDIITSTSRSGFYIAASIGSRNTTVNTTVNTTASAEWKLQYKKNDGIWIDLSSSISSDMTNLDDRILVSLVGSLPDNTAAGDYSFRIAHIQTSTGSIIETSNANIVAVSLEGSTGIYPVFSHQSIGGSTTSTTMSNIATATVNPSINLDVFMHAQYEISGDEEINAPEYDLYVDNGIFDGTDQKRYISGSTDKGAGASVGIATRLIAGTTYDISLRHSSDGTNSTTTNNILLTGFGLDISTTPLPIALLSFDALIEDDKINLNWQTASEENNDYFTIERSVNGLDWVEIERIIGAGNSDMVLSYSTLDYNPINGISYYRLKQTDYDGGYTVSKIVSINLEQNINNQISIYPNPSSNQITITANNINVEDIVVFNPLGQNVTNLTQISNQNEDMLIINISKLNNGTYFLRTQDNVSKFMKK